MLGRRSCAVSGLGDAAVANETVGCGTGRRPRDEASVVGCVGSRCAGVSAVVWSSSLPGTDPTTRVQGPMLTGAHGDGDSTRQWFAGTQTAGTQGDGVGEVVPLCWVCEMK